MKDKKQFPIEPMTPVIVRDNEDRSWRARLFEELNKPPVLLHPFKTFDEDFSQLAPLAGNESAIGTKNDVFELWDADRLKEEGII